MNIKQLIFVLSVLFATSATAQVYNIDPSHTFPSFEADHMGPSFWRGKFTKSSGKIVLDRQSKTGGSVEIVIDASTVDFGHAKMNEKARGDEMFNVAKFPNVLFKSTALKYEGERLVMVDGEMTLLGVTKPMPLKVTHFKCMMHPMLKREVCGGDFETTIMRSQWGMNWGIDFGIPDKVKLLIQVEAVKQ